VDGLLLSNHGGRQLDTGPRDDSTCCRRSSPRWADGFRCCSTADPSRTDVVKALALGARGRRDRTPSGVGAGRRRRDGVRRVLEILRDELDHTMALCGAANLRDLTPDLVRGHPWSG